MSRVTVSLSSTLTCNRMVGGSLGGEEQIRTSSSFSSSSSSSTFSGHPLQDLSSSVNCQTSVDIDKRNIINVNNSFKSSVSINAGGGLL